MRSLVVLLVALICGCSDTSQEPDHHSRPTLQTIKADYALPAFGGRLLGTDRGEWVGELLFQDEAGRLETLLHENVHGIVENQAGVFVFTGLDHMRTSVGDIYTVVLTKNNDVIANRLGRIPGAPRSVTKQRDGTITFLVATRRYDGEGRPVYDCYELRDKLVGRSLSCLPPKPLGHNNSSKPNLLRGSA
jgi:hypothetical protein